MRQRERPACSGACVRAGVRAKSSAPAQKRGGQVGKRRSKFGSAASSYKSPKYPLCLPPGLQTASGVLLPALINLQTASMSLRASASGLWLANSALASSAAGSRSAVDPVGARLVLG